MAKHNKVKSTHIMKHKKVPTKKHDISNSWGTHLCKKLKERPK